MNIMQQLLTSFARSQRDPSMQFGWGGFSGAGDPGGSGGGGPPNERRQHARFAGDESAYAPPIIPAHYQAWKQLFKPLGWSIGDANQIYKFARQGKLQLSPEGFQVIVPEGSTGWSSNWMNPTGAVNQGLGQDELMLKALQLRQNLQDLARTSVQRRNVRALQKRQR